MGVDRQWREAALTRSNPTVARRQLAVLLNNERERHGRSLEDLARFLEVSAPQASRLVSGARGFRPDQVRRLAVWYGLDLVATRRLLALAEESRRREWWQQVDLQDSYRTYIGMEQAAETIYEYAVSVVPGLLQTPDYARVAASVGETAIGPHTDPAKVEQAVEVRMRRQEILQRAAPPMLGVVIDEATLARGPRDRVIRLAQLRHLRESADRPGVTVQVISFEYGLHPAANNQFILLEMGDGLPGLYYTEGMDGSSDSSDEQVLARFRLIWNELRAKALDEFTSRERIDRYLRDLS